MTDTHPTIQERGAGAPGASDSVDPRDPYGIKPATPWVAPILAFAGLILIGWVTLGLASGDLRVPAPLQPGPGNPVGGGGVRTAAPSDVVVVPKDPRADVPGSIVYVKAGNVWLQSGTSASQLTTTGTASQPAFSADGRWIYYIETREASGLFPAQGVPRRYEMDVPSLMRLASDGSTEPEELATGSFTPRGFTWFHWLRQPAPSPDGKTIAILSDGPNPTQRNVIVQLFDLASRGFTVPEIPESAPLGHQDPSWRPDGGLLLAVRNDRDDAGGAGGAPTIVGWDPATGQSADLAGPGYLSPSWSRDMRWIAATKTGNIGTDVVILDAATGAEVFRVTNDESSWAPVWSPIGDAVAFLHAEDGIVDLRLAMLEGTAPVWQVTGTIDLTEVSGLDAISRPAWFVPPGQLPPLPTPGPSSLPSDAGESGALASPSP